LPGRAPRFALARRSRAPRHARSRDWVEALDHRRAQSPSWAL